MTKKRTDYPKGKYPRTEEHRQKLRDAAAARKARGVPGPNSGKSHSDATKRKIAASNMRRWSKIVRQPVEVRVCAQCEQEFEMTNGSKVDRRFCGKACATKSRGRGPDHPNWKGGRTIDVSGYVHVRVDGQYVLEHRKVMEQMIGRPLTSEEGVHHRNTDRQDNRPENLELRSRYHGGGGTHHCPTCTCGGDCIPKLGTVVLRDDGFVEDAGITHAA